MWARKRCKRAARHVERDDTAAGAVLHDQVDREIFDEETCLVFQRLLVQRVQHRVARAIGRRARALRDALAVMRGHAAEGPLIDATVFGAGKRHAVVLEFDDRGRRFLAHELDRVLVAEPVRSLDGVVEMEAPVVFAHVAERGADATLRGDGVAARREHLGDASRMEALLRQAERGTQACATRADHDDVVGVIRELVGSRSCLDSESDAQHGKHADEGGRHQRELDGDQHDDARALCRTRSLRR